MIDTTFAEVLHWAISPQHASFISNYRNKFKVTLSNTDKDTLVESEQVDFTVLKGIAIVNVRGVLLKRSSFIFRGSSLKTIEQTFDRLRIDNAIRGVVVNVDSPGGSVAGTNEAAMALRKLSEAKPTLSYCCDLTASAAYWIASQAREVSANAPALVGSIGTYCVVPDSSEAAEKAEVIVHVVRAGEFKGVGTPGTAITDEHLEHMQHLVDGINEHFLKAVRKGRSMSKEQLSKVSDGRTFIAADAKKLNLIDRIEKFEDAFDRFEEAIR